MSESGRIVWPSSGEPIWRFDWLLADSPDAEGIVISKAFYYGHEVFYKASLPLLRVQYDGQCGPYKELLNYDNSKTTIRSPKARVCTYSYVSNGLRGIGIEGYHITGNHRTTERWVFWEDGQVYPRLYSAGLQCNENHRHHAYWRLDFDIDGPGNDLVLEYNSDAPPQGWGRGWRACTHEISRSKNLGAGRVWAIMDKGSGRGYLIAPGPYDGHSDTFSNRDLWVTRYHPEEDRHGTQGNAYDDGLQIYMNGEETEGHDNVLWYCAHLSHEAQGGGDEWHHAGPNLIPFGNWQIGNSQKA